MYFIILLHTYLLIALLFLYYFSIFIICNFYILYFNIIQFILSYATIILNSLSSCFEFVCSANTFPIFFFLLYLLYCYEFLLYPGMN